jgi:CBS domain-containing protein
MIVAHVMQPKVRTIDPDASTADVVINFADAHISALPVVDHAGRLLGVVSHTDLIALEAEAEQRDPGELLRGTAVRDIMTLRTLTIAPDADVRDAAREMLYAEVHRLFVEDDGELVGVISTTDVVRAVATGKI